MVSRSSGKRSNRSSNKHDRPGAKKGKGSRSRKQDKGKTADSSPQDELSPRQKLIAEREAAALRKEIISYVVSLAFGCGFLAFLIALLVDPKIGLAAGAALMCLALAFKYQRLAIYAFIIYVPFAGTVTYALGGNSLLQIAKDIFYVPALIGVYQFCRKNRLPIILPTALKTPLIVVVLLVSVTALLTNVPDQITGSGGKYPILMAVLGFKILFGYIPLVACIYYLIRNKADLVGLLRLQVVLVLVACGLGFIQYIFLKTGVCQGTVGTGDDLFKASLEAKCFVGGSLLYSPEFNQIRLPGTFVAPWQWGWFLISAAFFSFGTTFSDKSAFWRTVGLASLVAVMVMSVVSGQRIALVLVPTAIVALTVLTGQVANLKRFVPIGVVLGVVLAYLVISNPSVIQTRVDSLLSRWEASPPQQFIVGQFQHVLKEQEGLFGHGVGRATNSARTFGDTALLETYHPKLLYEIGPLGLLAVLALYTTLTVVTFRVYRKTKDKNLRSYAAAMWVFILFISYCPYYYPLDVDPVAVYYWLAAGIVLKIPAIERQEQEKAAAALEAEQIEAGIAVKPKRGRKRTEQPTFE